MRPSWVPLAADDPFPLENLPLGAFARSEGDVAHLGIGIGAHVVDLAIAASLGVFDDVAPHARASLASPTWNALFARGRGAVRAIRDRLQSLLANEARDEPAARAIAESALVRAKDVRLVLPVAPGDYVDFYASVAHATRVAAIFRPGEPPLPAAYRHLPIGYHGRAGSIVLSGTPIVRPAGQSARDGTVTFAPTAMLDYECELAYVTAQGPPLGTPIAIDAAREAIVGVALLNDWSARDLQSFEYRPLGPFLGKSFATTLGAWIVTLDALEPYRTPGPEQRPEPAAYLRELEPRADGVRCEIALATRETRAAGAPPFRLARPRAASLYWSAAQMLAHLTSNGACVRAGDLFATGTISSDEGEGAFEPGSFLEVTHGGVRPFVATLPDGTRVAREFLEDGDEIVLTAWCGGEEGRPRIGFGEARGTIVPARLTSAR